MILLEYALPAAFAGLVGTGAFLDIRSRRIPNVLTAGILVLGLAASWYGGGGAGALSALEHFGVALALGMLAFAAKLWGGGDGKFYAAVAAWFPLAAFARLILAISVSGLVLVGAWFVIRQFRRGPKMSLKGELPFGVAIAAGGLLVMALETFGVPS